MDSRVDTTARWWYRDGEYVVCELCPRRCRIKPGARGFCFVRANDEGSLSLTTYGRCSGFCVDPIEKKPLYHFLPGTPVLSLGTAGCNLGCKFCQNWDLTKSRATERASDHAPPELVVAAAREYDCPSIAFTYNDPTIWAEYAIDIARLARAEGIRTVAVTAGYINPKPRAEFFEWIDAANIDLKAFEDDFYRRLTRSELAPVLDTIRYLKHETDVWIELTNLVIPGENDSVEETRRLCDWVLRELGDQVPVHFSAFHPDFKMRDTKATPHATLVRAREVALEVGLRFVYVGNVHDPERETTHCPGCGASVIGRDRYELRRYALRGGRCAECDTTVAGVFPPEGQGPGRWGRRRLPVGAAPAPKLDFDEDEARALLGAARAHVRAAATGSRADPPLAEDLALAPAYGLFVTLERGARLRGCRGRWVDANLVGLGDLLAEVARDTATDDPRFPRISAAESEALTIELSIMHSPRLRPERGDDLVDAIEVGEHGLYIVHPDGRGLLLPHVASERGWDARTFLEQLCFKAGIGRDAWRSPEAEVHSFRTVLLEARPDAPELVPRELGATRLRALVEIARAALHEQPGRASEDPELDRVRPDPLGIYLENRAGLSALVVARDQSLHERAWNAAHALRDRALRQHVAPGGLARMVILSSAIELDPRDGPDRLALLAEPALVGRCGEHWHLEQGAAAVAIDRVLVELGETAASWRRGEVEITAFDALRVRIPPPPGRAGTDGVRSAAVAGIFFPADPEAMRREVRHYLSEVEEPARCRAILLPHAGWHYCGPVVGMTVSRVEVPERVIIIGPRHTPSGADWSIASHREWEIPGARIPVDTELVAALDEAVPRLHCEPAAHAAEHCIEVLLPFLHHRQPRLRIAPIVIGSAEYVDTAELARGLTAVVTEAADPILIVVSSDMNHFARDERNRELDGIALDALKQSDPEGLYTTCVQNDITMCGMRPAVAVMRHLAASGPFAPEVVAYDTSARASGDVSSVVGYAGAVIP